MTEQQPDLSSLHDEFEYWTPDRIASAVPAPRPSSPPAQLTVDIDSQLDPSTDDGLGGGAGRIYDNGDDDDPDLGGDPEPVSDVSAEPWRYIGRLTAAWVQEDRRYWTTAVVVGESTILMSSIILAIQNRKPDSLLFTPGYSWPSTARSYSSPYGDWLVEKWDFSEKIKREQQYWTQTYWNRNVFFDYAFGTVGNRVRRSSSTHDDRVETQTIASVLKAGTSSRGYLDVDKAFFPRDANKERNIELTSVAYANNYEDGRVMYHQTGNYIGSMIRKIPGRSGYTRNGFSMYQGYSIANDAYGLQMTNTRFGGAVNAGPILHRNQDSSRYEVVGLNVAQAAGIGYSPTFSSLDFGRLARSRGI